MATSNTEHVNIRPGVSILSVLRHLNYKSWFALAEFVDNSLQSYLTNEKELKKIEGDKFKLEVAIELNLIDDGQIIIRDNAAGIHTKDFPRAFRPAELPPDRNGLSEFGMGMKSAACWLADLWTVRTSSIGDDIEKIVDFDIDKIVKDDIEELSVQTSPTPYKSHFTEITLRSLNQMPQKKTVAKIKDHLASIYRIYIREGRLTLIFNNEVLTYSSPKVLFAPYYKNLEDTPKLWRKEIKFDFGLDLKVHGFAALRDVASTSDAGFGLFRRNRLIEGSGDDSYRPKAIFGGPNSYAYQRLFGELHLEGFDVSHTKDGFRWEENEETFLDLLKEYLDKEPLPLLDQAEGHRVRPKPKELVIGAEKASKQTAEIIERDVPSIFQQQVNLQPVIQAPPTSLPLVTQAAQRLINVELNGSQWQIILELSNDPAVGDWVSIYDQVVTESDIFGNTVRRLGVRLSLAHPFMQNFAGADHSKIEPLLRIAVAIVLSETTARESGVRMAGTIRRNINDLLRNVFFK